MQKKSNFEKTLLLVMALLAVGVSGYLIYLTTGFSEKLTQKPVTPRKEMGEVPIASVQEATKLLKQVFNWTSPIKNNKPVPLNKSIMVILKGDSLVDIYVPEPPLRPPMTNEFLVKNKIPNVLSPNVGDLDPDGDGYTTLEEFNKGTDPRDPAKHPPFTDHLYFKQRTADDYIVKLNNSLDPYQVVLLAPRRDSAYIQPPFPKPFGFKDPVTKQINERFVAKKFEKKEVPDPNTGVPKDASELTVEDRATKSEFMLIKGVEKNLADYYAVFEFWQKEISVIKVKKGETFPVMGVTYRLLEVEETQAVIAEVKPDQSQGAKLVIKPR
jgi:hypothetical protein